jgi:hypothetical protein
LRTRGADGELKLASFFCRINFYCAGTCRIFHLHAFGVLCLYSRRGRQAKARLIFSSCRIFIAPERFEFFSYTPSACFVCTRGADGKLKLASFFHRVGFLLRRNV